VHAKCSYKMTMSIKMGHKLMGGRLWTVLLWLTVGDIGGLM
jgi:hypothetical protein